MLKYCILYWCNEGNLLIYLLLLPVSVLHIYLFWYLDSINTVKLFPRSLLLYSDIKNKYIITICIILPLFMNKVTPRARSRVPDLMFWKFFLKRVVLYECIWKARHTHTHTHTHSHNNNNTPTHDHNNS